MVVLIEATVLILFVAAIIFVAWFIRYFGGRRRKV